MSSFAEWLEPRKPVLAWILAGYTTFVLVFGAVWLAAPRLDPIAGATDRLLLAVQLAALPAAVALLMLQGLWRATDTVEAESRPLDGLESPRWKVNQRVLSNTVEQTVIFVPMFVALAVRIDPAYTFALPFLMGVWCVGRLLFWVGYQIQPRARAIGMDWTSSVAMITAGWLLVTLA